MNTVCPVCKNKTNLWFPIEIGQYVSCDVCKSSLEVIWLFPISLDPVEYQSHSPLNTPTPDDLNQKNQID